MSRARSALLLLGTAVVFLVAAVPAAAAAPPPTLWQAGETGAGAGQTVLPRGIGVDPHNGHVFVADQNNRRIDEFTAWGDFVKAWGWDVVASGPGDDTAPPEDQFEICVPADGDVCKAGNTGGGSGQIVLPQGIAIDSGGNVYVAEGDFTNRRVQKFDSEGNFVLMFGGDVNKTKFEAAAPEAEQNLCPVDPGDVCQAGVQGGGDGQFSDWVAGSYLAIDAKGTETLTDDELYVGDRERIQAFDVEGHYLEDLPDPEGLLAGNTVSALAVDPSGSRYLVVKDDHANTGNAVHVLTPTGEETCTMSVGRPSAIAVEPTTGRVWVVSAAKDGTPRIPMRIAQFDSASCAETTSFAADFDEGFVESTGIATNLCPGSKSPGSLFVSNVSSSDAFVRAYGTPPEGCEPPPPVPPLIGAQYPLAVDTDSATLRAEINSRFIDDTTYFVEYESAQCAAGSCAERAPLSGEAQLTGGVTNIPQKTAGVFLSGLSPDTAYHYRFVAKSSGGGPVYGEEATFATPSLPPPSKPDCPNQALRTGPSAFLPDCRAYEMVSPVDKNGFGIEAGIVGANPLAYATLDQSASDGEGLTYSSRQAFAGAPSTPWSVQYLSRRDPANGWSTHGISPPLESFPGSERIEFDTEFKAFSEDLSESWLFHNGDPALAPCAPPDSPVLYRRDNATADYEALHCEPNKKTNPWNSIDLQGLSEDGCRAVFRANSQLTADAEPTGPYQLYESSCEGPLRLVSVLPNGKACAESNTAGSPPTNPSGGNSVESHGRLMNVWHAFSTDAKRLYWSCQNGSLYLRTDPDRALAGDEKTVKITPLQCTGGLCFAVPARFQTASPDGSRALLIAENTLFSYDAEANALSEVAAGLPSKTNLLGASEDATRAYFASTEVLTAAPNSEGEEAIAGQPNLYLHEEGAGFDFIGTLSEGDRSASSEPRTLSPLHVQSFRHAARVSADGLHAAFISTAPLTGYDNTDLASGRALNEVFLYDADPAGGPGELHCVSCNPTGARPTGRNVNEEGGGSAFWAAAWIPGWHTQLYQNRPLSGDASRLYFNSVDALVNRDTNGQDDVYQWERAQSKAQCTGEQGGEQYVPDSGGCLSLISSGQDPVDSEFVDADRDGSDVFIRTAESLLPQDPGLRDIYDVRIGGGFPQPLEEPECEGGACQSPPPPPPFPAPASASFKGPGDLGQPKARRCPKGKRKVVRRGEARCVTRKQRKQARQQREAKRNGRAAR
jgi:DNA-binding beta-propeller fold protein YncE